MNRGFTILGGTSLIAIAIAILSIPFYLWILPELHDKTLDQFSEPLLSISVPEGTQVLDTLSSIGLQTGNSNHCDYLAALLVKTDLPRVEIEQYYKGKYDGDSEVEFFWTNDTHEPSVIDIVNPTGIYTLNDWVNVKSKETEANLIIYIFEGALTSSIDFRCR
jgi:hypothetical protein